jgi:hypothetical protein
MESTLKLQVKSVYGVERVFPMCDQSKKLVQLMARKTFTSADLVLIKELGFKIVWVPISM